MWHPGIPDEWRNQIVTGDALELAKRIPDKSIDIVFTSPLFKDEDVDGPYWDWYSSWWDEINRVCGKVLCVVHSATKMTELAQRYPPKRWLIWGKGISQYSWRFNPILVYQMNDEYSVNRRIWSDAFGVQSVTSADKSHKYEDPLELYRLVIGMFTECKTLLDPFCGSGTALAAAKLLRMDYIGFEIDAAAAEKARERVAHTQPPLFVAQHEQLTLTELTEAAS